MYSASPVELRIGTGASQDLGIASGKGAPALALQRHGDNGRTTASGTGSDHLVNELDKLIRESHGDLRTHPIMVANWYRHRHADARAHFDRGWILQRVDGAPPGSSS